MIHINNISLSFGEKEIFERINWFITEKSRIGLVGDNGQGKTTLTRLMSKAEEPTSEELKYGLNVKMAFFSQESAGRTSEYFLSGRLGHAWPDGCRTGGFRGSAPGRPVPTERARGRWLMER